MESGTLTPLSQYPLDTWSKAMLVNLNPQKMLTRACIDLLKQAYHAPVDFSTSELPRQGPPNCGNYSITGHANK